MLQEQEKKSKSVGTNIFIYIIIKEIPKHTRINCITFIIRELAVHAYIHIHIHIIYTQIYVIYNSNNFHNDTDFFN